ncbi:MAG: 50S ribosomal protein L32 [Candidatus Moranbacteria bacterium]|nr:50S ribosomal protein L32 [Candidatus Moranbacteria bacterium]
MSVPKQHHTKGRRDRRRVRFAIGSKGLVACSQCKKQVKPHEACPYCGFYKGKSAVSVKAKKAKKKK